MTNSKKNTLFKILSIAFIFISITVFCLGLVKVTCYETVIVEGNSMNPTLKDGDYGYLLKTESAKKNLDRFDIIVFEKEQEMYIKRVIGLPLETISFSTSNQNLMVDGSMVKQNFISLEVQKSTFNNKPIYDLDEKINIPENAYFVLGDNRDNSFDSLHGLGFILQNEIKGIYSCKTGHMMDDKFIFTGLQYF